MRVCKNCVWVGVYLLVWSWANSDLQLSKTLLQFRHLRGQNKATHGWQWQQHPTRHKHPHTHLPAFCPAHCHQIFWHSSYENENKTSGADHTAKHLLVNSSETSIHHPFHFTLADSLNFSCSGRLCSSYSTTPSGPLAKAVDLPSPAALPRLPLAASSWVSRRLREGRKRRHKRIICSILLSAPWAAVLSPLLLVPIFSASSVICRVKVSEQFSSRFLPLVTGYVYMHKMSQSEYCHIPCVQV